MSESSSRRSDIHLLLSFNQWKFQPIVKALLSSNDLASSDQSKINPMICAEPSNLDSNVSEARSHDRVYRSSKAQYAPDEYLAYFRKIRWTRWLWKVRVQYEFGSFRICLSAHFYARRARRSSNNRKKVSASSTGFRFCQRLQVEHFFRTTILYQIFLVPVLLFTWFSRRSWSGVFDFFMDNPKSLWFS